MVESVAVDINTLNCGYFFNNKKRIIKGKKIIPIIKKPKTSKDNRGKSHNHCDVTLGLCFSDGGACQDITIKKRRFK